MSVTHPTAVRNSIADFVCAKINAGTGTSSGRLVFLPVGSTAYATLPMSSTAFAGAIGGVATANAITQDSDAVGGGVVTRFEMRDRDGNVIFQGSVGTSGADINMSSTNITVHDIVVVSALTYTASP